MYLPLGKRQSAPREYFNGALLNFLNRRYEYGNKNRENVGLVFMRNLNLVKPDLHIVVTIAQHACDRVLKRIIKLSTYRLQIFLVKYEYLRSLQLYEDKAYVESLSKPVCNMPLRSLRLIWRPGFKFESCSENVEQGRFQSF